MDIILKKILYINIILSIFYPSNFFSQKKKIIEIIEAGRFTKDEENFPKANILSKANDSRVRLFHDGATITSGDNKKNLYFNDLIPDFNIPMSCLNKLYLSPHSFVILFFEKNSVEAIFFPALFDNK